MTGKRLPIIDLAKLDNPDTRQELLEELRDALFKIGFLYLVNHGMETEAEKIMSIAPKAFEVPTEEKEKIAMATNSHFVGYSKLGAEFTAKKSDLREQFDFGSATSIDPKSPEVAPGNPAWRKIQGPTPYLPDSVLPGFESTVKSYINGMDKLTTRLLELISESLNLPSDSLQPFVGEMNRLKIVKYPGTDGQSQGVGPHKDSSGMLTFVLQDDVGGLEVLDSDGEWIAATPIPGSFVVNIAQGFEALTGGRCCATTHRVQSPPAGVTRYSIPYFHSVRLSLTLKEIEDQLKFIQGKIPEPADDKRRKVATFSEFLDPRYSCFGEAHLRNRILSHRDVAERWYSDVKDQYLKEIGS